MVLCLCSFSPVFAQTLIDFADPTDLAQRQPILIAHRGGVITPNSPECSLSAIRLAGEQDYDMVELDLRASLDGIPIVFHDRTLKEACGRPESVADLNSKQLTAIRYLKGGDRIITFEEALIACHRQGLGIMLDIKTGREDRSFLQQIDRLIQAHGFQNATITFTGTNQARENLKSARFTLTQAELKQIRLGTELNLPRRFWFGLPSQLPLKDIPRLKKAGVVILPAINTFRYPSADHYALAKRDVTKLLNLGVHGFQIDSIYHDLFTQKTAASPSR